MSGMTRKVVLKHLGTSVEMRQSRKGYLWVYIERFE
jgi:hypothetical protein